MEKAKEGDWKTPNGKITVNEYYKDGELFLQSAGGGKYRLRGSSTPLYSEGDEIAFCVDSTGKPVPQTIEEHKVIETAPTKTITGHIRIMSLDSTKVARKFSELLPVSRLREIGYLLIRRSSDIIAVKRDIFSPTENPAKDIKEAENIVHKYSLDESSLGRSEEKFTYTDQNGEHEEFRRDFSFKTDEREIKCDPPDEHWDDRSGNTGQIVKLRGHRGGYLRDVPTPSVIDIPMFAINGEFVSRDKRTSDKLSEEIEKWMNCSYFNKTGCTVIDANRLASEDKVWRNAIIETLMVRLLGTSRTENAEDDDDESITDTGYEPKYSKSYLIWAHTAFGNQEAAYLENIYNHHLPNASPRLTEDETMKMRKNRINTVRYAGMLQNSIIKLNDINELYEDFWDSRRHQHVSCNYYTSVASVNPMLSTNSNTLHRIFVHSALAHAVKDEIIAFRNLEIVYDSQFKKVLSVKWFDME